MRIGEAFALDADDLDTEAQVLTVTGKYGRKRLIALHPSAAVALPGYLRFREQHAADGTAALSSARRAAALAQRGLHDLPVADRRMRPGTPARLRSPRLHDFRHAFAVSTLLDAHRQGLDVDARIAVLSTHLGHIGPPTRTGT